MKKDEQRAARAFAKAEENARAAVAASETVKVILPSVSGQTEVEVGLNGRFFLIKRGVPLELPLPLVEVLQHAGML